MANIYDIRKAFQYKLDQVPNIARDMIVKLVLDSDEIWQLLKYNTRDALSQPVLTTNEKFDLIEFEKKLSESDCPFKLVPYMSGQTLGVETTEIRLYPYDTNFTNKTYVQQVYKIDVITHYNNYLITGGYRLERLKKELVRVLNNYNYDDSVGILGSLTVDDTNSRTQFYNDSYTGFSLLLRGDVNGDAK